MYTDILLRDINLFSNLTLFFLYKQLWKVALFTENMMAAKFRLQCADYNSCKGHLTGILPLFYL